jgi:hypothetical protein
MQYFGPVVASVVAEEIIDRVDGPPQSIEELLQEQNRILAELANALSPSAKPDRNRTISILPYPNEVNLHPVDYPHLCLFLPKATPLRIEIPGVGIYQKTLGPGWVQMDLDDGIVLASFDTNTYIGIVRWCVDAIGVAL